MALWGLFLGGLFLFWGDSLTLAALTVQGELVMPCFPKELLTAVT